MDAIVKSYTLEQFGVTASVEIDGMLFGVPIQLDWSDPNLRDTVCATVKMNCAANGKPADRVVLPDLHVG
jgi:hypothetical protein